MNVYVPPIIEKVYNIQGSTAAPGSGEYHRYRALRRRERTIAAAMEKEVKAKEEQRKFEQEKQMKQEQIELATLKRKKSREKKNLFRKIKKRMNSKNEVIFDKNIPLIEQVKNEIGKEEFNELFNQNEMKNNDDNDTYLMKPNISAMNKNNNLTSENGEEISNNNEINPLKKLFPTIQKKEIEFENYEDYEDHLTELKIKEEQKKKEESKKEISKLTEAEILKRFEENPEEVEELLSSI